MRRPGTDKLNAHEIPEVTSRILPERPSNRPVKKSSHIAEGLQRAGRFCDACGSSKKPPAPRWREAFMFLGNPYEKPIC